MFSTKHNMKSTLLCGPAELSKSFMFEVLGELRGSRETTRRVAHLRYLTLRTLNRRLRHLC
ncbi:uncharacterized protein LOC143148202 [Ptiloglossa arizonensis]|uniref:uncharacterized protein LOC143148202 n=1 Tax=Ptiloglossa arizonensis TaxID=3350558 RepID=UPI003F9EDA89